LYRDSKWDALDDVLGHTTSAPILNWMAEKERIRKLAWWAEVAARGIFPENGKVYHLQPIGLKLAPHQEESLLVTREQLSLIMKSASGETIDKYLLPINKAMAIFEINSHLRISHFLAQVAHETAELKYSEELASGSAYEWREDLGNTQAGDGRRFKGRGLLQLTGRSNYEACENYLAALNMVTDITSSTEMAKRVSDSPEISALASGYFWSKIKPRINEAADIDDLYWVSVYVNGWAQQSNPYYPNRELEPNHMRERAAMLARTKEILAIK
ncbi:glycoside hydrolase family 19 protein, partial [Metapseudomonas boanensis]|nr:hypothetical protein [Pseudomonas boanensis]